MWLIYYTNYNPQGQKLSVVNLCLIKDDKQATHMMREKAEVWGREHTINHYAFFTEVTYNGGYHSHFCKEWVEIQ